MAHSTGLNSAWQHLATVALDVDDEVTPTSKGFHTMTTLCRKSYYLEGVGNVGIHAQLSDVSANWLMCEMCNCRIDTERPHPLVSSWALGPVVGQASNCAKVCVWNPDATNQLSTRYLQGTSHSGVGSNSAAIGCMHQGQGLSDA